MMTMYETSAVPQASNSLEWPCDQESYKRVARIGQGIFSEVWSAICDSQGNRRVAVKIMDLEHVSMDEILHEVQIMRLCAHPNILQCHCSFVVTDRLWLVSSLMDRGSCLSILKYFKRVYEEEGFVEDVVGFIMCETLKGLSYLHSRGHIHRDVKSGNILIDHLGNVKLADFGVSGWTMQSGQRQNTVKTLVGTPCYMAPEVMEQQTGYDNRADVWSAGITALELAKGHAPYAFMPPMKIVVLTLEQDPPSLKNYSHDKQISSNGEPFSKFFEDFYRKCLQKNPKLRPSSAELLKHKFLRGKSKETFLNFLEKTVDIENYKMGSSEEVEIYNEIDETAQDYLHTIRRETEPNYDFTVSKSVQITADPISAPAAKLEDSFVAGTSWVFETEQYPNEAVISIVQAKSVDSKLLPVSASEVKEFLDEFAEEDATM